MAVYKLFAEKDATIYSDYGTMNTGLDPILELNKNVSLRYSGQSSAARMLIKFSSEEISQLVSQSVGSKRMSANLRMFLADSTGLPTDYTLEAVPIYGSWDMGTGQFGDLPTTENGVSWLYRTSPSVFSGWETGSFALGTTGSFKYVNPGGGVWYTASVCTQSFGIYTNKDINIDVTKIVLGYLSGSFSNEGILVKTSGSLEFDEKYNYTLNFFSRDTNTIYPPVLEIKWDDQFFQTSGSIVNNQDVAVSLSNNKELYEESEIYRFRTSVRELYPSRTFATSSIYNQQKFLPSSSYFAIKDLKSDIFVVDFDENYTKISADSRSNYFDIYMNGLEPERYYKIVIKSVIGNSTVVFDDRQIFKVTQ